MIFLLFLCIFQAQASQPHDTLDPAFERVPFEQWLTERSQAPYHWTANVTHAELSFHQRFVSHIAIEVDGRDLANRRNNGELIFFIQIRDSNGTRYQTHGTVDLSKLDPNIKSATLQSDQRAFFLPGDYQLATAILDTGNGDHAVLQSKMRVASAPSGFLAEAWHGLPPVEFTRDQPSPEGWFMPDLQGQVQWAADVSLPSRVNVVLNIAPQPPGMGTRRIASQGLSALLPTFKFLSQSGSAAIAQHDELIDLARRKAVFQSDEHELDWTALKSSLSEASTASIDLGSLSDRHHDAQFFVSEIRRILRASDKPSVLVILSTPIAFESGEDLEQISLESLPAHRVFYIRYNGTPERRPSQLGPQMGRGRGMRMGGAPGMNRRPMQLNVIDQLEATLKPLSPKLFDVETPEEIAKALAEIHKALEPR